MPIVIALAAFVSTLLGGVFALKFKDQLHLILGFSAGAVIGVAFFDLMPEAIELGSRFYTAAFVTTLIAAGFLAYMLLDRLLLLAEEHVFKDTHGYLGPATLTFHSFL